MTTPLVTTAWLNENINDPKLIILDASPKTNVSGLKSDFEHLQIPGARYADVDNQLSDTTSNLPHTLLSANQFQTQARALGINKDSKIVVYDNLGIYLSPRVWWMFLAMGHTNIAVLDGGLPAWVNAGYPTQAIQPTSIHTGNFEATLQPERIRNIDYIKQNIQKQESIIVDARSAGRFSGTAPEPRPALSSGHIPGSVNLPFPEVLANGQLKPKAQLQTLFAQLNLGNKPLVFSCGSGVTACIILLASELVLPNTKAVYDGSWTDWAQAPDVEIEKL